jgi:hypothetical protein
MALQFPEGVSTRKELKDWLLEDVAESRLEIIESKSSDFGKTLWVATRPENPNPRMAENQARIICFRMEKGDDTWGYTEYEEGMAPFVDCPVSLFDAAGPAPTLRAEKWRKRVLAK